MTDFDPSFEDADRRPGLDSSLVQEQALSARDDPLAPEPGEERSRRPSPDRRSRDDVTATASGRVDHFNRDLNIIAQQLII